jgi:hypothetical protein
VPLLAFMDRWVLVMKIQPQAIQGGTLNNSAYTYCMSSGTTNSFAGTATLGYYFLVTDNFLLGLGAEYSPKGAST